MRAVRFHGKGDLRIEDIAKPELQPGEILIEVEWCGICGTDLHEYEFGPWVIPRPSRPHPLTGASLPVTMGHEFCGRVVALPAGAPFAIGDAVMVDPRLYCTRCHMCQTDVEQLCKSWGFLGLSGHHGGGGFSEYVAVDIRMCHRLPNHVKLDEAVLIEPLAVGRHALSMAGMDDFTDKAVLVIGGGPIGLCVIWNLRAMGAKQIILSEPSAIRRENSRDIADVILDPLETNVPDHCRALTDGLGVHVVVDCAGVSAGMKAGMDALRARGTYITAAGWVEPFVLPVGFTMTKEIITKFSMSYSSADYKAVVDGFVRGDFKGVERMISDRILMEDLPGMFGSLSKDKDRYVKVIATPKSELVGR